jgi:hypothetical protein
MGKPHTIIGAKQFHFRVRDGIGWFPLANAARQTVMKKGMKKGTDLFFFFDNLFGCQIHRKNKSVPYFQSVPCFQILESCKGEYVA